MWFRAELRVILLSQPWQKATAKRNNITKENNGMK